MAILATPTLLARINSREYNVRWRVLIEDQNGVMQDYSNRDGINWQSSAEWGASSDQRIPDFRVELKREAGGLSLAPLVANAVNELGRAIEKNRKVQILAASVDVGGTPAAADWVVMLDGRVQTVAWGGLEGNLQITGVERTAELTRRIIRTKKAYGSAAGVNAATVAQEILDDAFGAGVWPLATPAGQPTFTVTEYIPLDVSVWDALEALVAQFGWIVAPRFLDGAWKLAMFPPTEITATTTPVATIGPTQYLDVQSLDEDLAAIRNIVRVRFFNRETGVEDFVELRDQASVDAFGDAYLGITESEASAIDTRPEAEGMATVILRDLATAPTRARIVNLFWQPVEVGDVITWAANPQLHTSDQTWAVDGYRHTLSETEALTTFATSGKAVAHFRRYLRPGGAAEGFRTNAQFDITVDAATGAVSVTPNSSDERAKSFRFRITAGTVQTDNFVEPTYDDTAAGEYAGTAWGTRIATSITLAEGQAAYVVGYAYETADPAPAAQKASPRSRAVRMWAPRGATGPDAVPVLDEDAAKLFLYPNRNKSAASVKWAKSTTGPVDAAAVRLGTVSTAESIEVHAFDPLGGEQRVWIGVLPYSAADGTGTEGPLRVRQYTFTAGQDAPGLTWQPVPGQNAAREAIQFIATDDDNQVAIYFRSYAQGATTLPAYTRVPATGFAADPLIHTVEVDVPAQGAADLLVEAYAQDAAGNASARVVLKVDAGTQPSGTFDVKADAAGHVWVSVNSQDPDAGSWRARVVVSSTEGAFSPVGYSNQTDGDVVWESADSVFGQRLDTGLRLLGGQHAYLTGHFYRTTEISAAAQQTSRRSAEIRAWTGGGDDTALALNNFREIGRTSTEITYGWEPGGAVDQIWIYNMIYEQPSPSDPWQTNREPDANLPGTATTYTAQLPGPGFDRYLQFEPRDRSLRAGSVRRATLTGVPAELPSVLSIRQAPGAAKNTTDVFAVSGDELGRPATWYAWVNRGSPNDADPNAAPDGRLAVAGPGTVGPADLWTLTDGSGTAALLDELVLHAGRGKRIYFEYRTSDGATSGVVDFLLHHYSDVIDAATGGLLDRVVTAAAVQQGAIGSFQLAKDAVTQEKIVNGAIDRAKVAAGFDFVGLTTGALPTTKSTDVIVNGGKVYRWDGTAYTSAIPAADVTGQIIASQIADAAIETAKFAQGIEPVSIVGGAALPTTKSTNAIVFNGKLYRWNGTAYTAAVPTADLTGQIGAALIEAGAIKTDHLDVNAVTAGKIATGAIRAGHILAGEIKADAIATDAIIARHVLAGEIKTAHLAAGAVTADKIFANAIIAGKIAAGAINATDLIVDGIITAAKLKVGTLSEIAPGAGIITSGVLRNAAGTQYINLSSVAEAAGAAITGDNIFLAHPKFTLYANGNAAFAGTLTADTVVAGTIIASSNLKDGAVGEARLIVDGIITARNLSIAQLDELTSNGPSGTKVGLGVIVNGLLRNAANTAGIRLSKTNVHGTAIALPTTTWLDLAAEAAEPVLRHPKFELRANGDAIFAGVLQAAGGEFAGNLKAAGGTFRGDLDLYQDNADTMIRFFDGAGALTQSMFYTTSGTITYIDFRYHEPGATGSIMHIMKSRVVMYANAEARNSFYIGGTGTIWMGSADAYIAGVIFSAEQPASPREGTIWVS